MIRVVASMLFTLGATISVAFLKENGMYLWLFLLGLCCFGMGVIITLQLQLAVQEDEEYTHPLHKRKTPN